MCTKSCGKQCCIGAHYTDRETDRKCSLMRWVLESRFLRR